MARLTKEQKAKLKADKAKLKAKMKADLEDAFSKLGITYSNPNSANCESALGVTRRQIYRVLDGDVPMPPSVRKLLKLAEAKGVDAKALEKL